jgi:hypothetical protein
MSLRLNSRLPRSLAQTLAFGRSYDPSAIQQKGLSAEPVGSMNHVFPELVTELRASAANPSADGED